MAQSNPSDTTTEALSDETLSAVLPESDALESYEVVAGDSLSAIAVRFGLSLEELIHLNNITNPNQLYVGQVLKLRLKPPLWPELPVPLVLGRLEPPLISQGHVAILSFGLSKTANLSAQFLGTNYHFYAPNPTSQAAILAVPVLTEPGIYELDLAIEQAGQTQKLKLPIQVIANNYQKESITLTYESSNLLDADISARETAKLEGACQNFKPEQRWQDAFASPVESVYITSEFGILRSYNGGPYNSFHRGLDFRANATIPIFAVADGTVVLAEALDIRGNTVLIDHGLGVCSGYMHLSQIDVAVGDELKTGDQLGYAGDTGMVTGPHLHLEVRVMGIPVNPAQWLEP
ncbi:MAG: M23 family metallopeptidase [Deinococcales bacterium]